MNSPSFLMRIVRGVQKRPVQFLALSGGSFLVLWSGFEPIVNLIGIKPANGPFWLICLILLAVLVGVLRCIPSTNVDIRFSNTQCRVEIKFGNIFAEEGIRVIPVNRFFDSELGDLVSPNSLHGKLLTSKFRGNRQEFDTAIAPHLSAKPSTEVSSKKGKVRDYGIGTTLLFGTSTERYLLISTADTDLATLKASTDFDTAWSALAELWSFARVNCGGDPIVVPLIGGGLSGLKLSHRRILDMILLSLVYHSRIRDIGCKVTVIIEPDRLSEIDLRDVASNWSS